MFKLKPDSTFSKFGKSQRTTISATLSMLFDNDFIQYIEDEFDCSGLCKPALFYLSKSIKYGPPKKTCMKVLKDVIKEAAKPYSFSAVIAAINALFLFIIHFGLYCRPLPDTPIEQAVSPRGMPLEGESPAPNYEIEM